VPKVSASLAAVPHSAQECSLYQVTIAKKALEMSENVHHVHIEQLKLLFYSP
jgi:hypothetical protein